MLYFHSNLEFEPETLFCRIFISVSSERYELVGLVCLVTSVAPCCALATSLVSLLLAAAKVTTLNDLRLHM